LRSFHTRILRSRCSASVRSSSACRTTRCSALRSSRPVVEPVTHPAGGDLQQIAEALVERVPVAPVVRQEAERHGGGDQKLLRRAAVPASSSTCQTPSTAASGSPRSGCSRGGTSAGTRRSGRASTSWRRPVCRTGPPVAPAGPGADPPDTRRTPCRPRPGCGYREGRMVSTRCRRRHAEGTPPALRAPRPARPAPPAVPAAGCGVGGAVRGGRGLPFRERPAGAVIDGADRPKRLLEQTSDPQCRQNSSALYPAFARAPSPPIAPNSASPTPNSTALTPGTPSRTTSSTSGAHGRTRSASRRAPYDR
jgi:hypothetical protein